MKKIFFIIFAVLNVNVLYSNDILKDVVYNGNLLPLDNLITPQQLMDFNIFELRILRNMIYAKYNYRFRSNDLHEYFSRFFWYNGIENDVENLLTSIDHRNVRTIQMLESHYPVVIPYNDERIYDFIHDESRYWLQNRYRNIYSIGNFLVFMGWSIDSKLFFANTHNWFNWFNEIYIFDLKNNRNVLRSLYADYTRANINIQLEIAERVHNIIPVTDLILTNIEGYSIYSKEIRYQPDTRYSEYYYSEIGLQNNLDNSTIKLGNIAGYGWRSLNRSGNPLTENDIFYLCVRSPFEENIIALIVIVPSYQGGNREGPVTYYSIFGINLNALHEINDPGDLSRDFFMKF